LLSTHLIELVLIEKSPAIAAGLLVMEEFSATTSG